MLAGGVVLTVVLVGAGPVGAKAEDPLAALPGVSSTVEACGLLLGDDPFAKAAPEGKAAPGDPFAVDVTWGDGWDGAPVEVVGCTALDGSYMAGASTRIRKTESDGLYVHEFAVPESAPDGSVLCEEAVVIGHSAAGDPRAERSGADCFTVVAASVSKPAPKPAAAKPVVAAGPAAPAAPEPMAAAAPVAAPARTQQQVAAPVPVPAPVAAAEPSLPRTGSGGRALAAVAGLLFILGGVAFGGSRPALASAPE
jgi:membrane anchored protein